MASVTPRPSYDDGKISTTRTDDDVDAHDYVSLPGIGVPETPCNFAAFEQQQLFVKVNEREYLEQNATTVEMLLNGAALNNSTGAQTLQHHDTLTVGCFVVFEVKGDDKCVAFGRAVQRPWREHIRRAMRQGSPPIKGTCACTGQLVRCVCCLVSLPLTRTVLFAPTGWVSQSCAYEFKKGTILRLRIRDD